ncbi:hypothetical protein HK098_006379 [Nowakowskiella sp. JEL0407]|nr:hypothetical protein HK098_006379 [Nowakowskiella sp. JEL0407]
MERNSSLIPPSRLLFDKYDYLSKTLSELPGTQGCVMVSLEHKCTENDCNQYIGSVKCGGKNDTLEEAARLSLDAVNKNAAATLFGMNDELKNNVRLKDQAIMLGLLRIG